MLILLLQKPDGQLGALMKSSLKNWQPNYNGCARIGIFTRIDNTVSGTWHKTIDLLRVLLSIPIKNVCQKQFTFTLDD